MTITASQLQQILPHLSQIRLAEYLPFLNAAMSEFSVNTPRRIAAFIAQVAHESGSFHYLTELATGEAYEGRRDLGNIQLGDGPRFKGRGVIQLTGRSNYVRASKALGIDLVTHPDLVATPAYAFRVAGLYWEWHELNKLADLGTEDAFKQITHIINGGFNGYADRVAYYTAARKVLVDTAPLPPPEKVLAPIYAPILPANLEANFPMNAEPLAPYTPAVPVQPPPPMPDFKQELYTRLAQVLARDGLKLLAGGLEAVGWFTPAQSTAFLSEQHVLYIAGLLVYLGGFLWSYYQTKKHLAEVNTTRSLAPVKADGEPLTYADVKVATKSGVFKPVTTEETK